MTVEELGDKLSILEFNEWAEFYRLEQEQNEAAAKKARRR